MIKHVLHSFFLYFVLFGTAFAAYSVTPSEGESLSDGVIGGSDIGAYGRVYLLADDVPWAPASNDVCGFWLVNEGDGSALGADLLDLYGKNTSAGVNCPSHLDGEAEFWWAVLNTGQSDWDQAPELFTVTQPEGGFEQSSTTASSTSDQVHQNLFNGFIIFGASAVFVIWNFRRRKR